MNIQAEGKEYGSPICCGDNIRISKTASEEVTEQTKEHIKLSKAYTIGFQEGSLTERLKYLNQIEDIQRNFQCLLQLAEQKGFVRGLRR